MSTNPVSEAPAPSTSTTGSNVAPTVAPVSSVKRIDEYLKEVLSRNGSDLHFIAGDPPRIRQYGELHPLRPEALAPDYVKDLLYEIMPRQAQQRLELSVAAGDTALSADEAAGVDSFARLYVRQGHGALVLSTPAGGANADAAALISRDVRLRLASAGVPFAAIAASTYEAPQGAAPIVLNFTRYSAEAPECEPLWSQNLAHASSNQPWRSFGCAQQANLAALISDPHDLIAPRPEDPRDAKGAAGRDCSRRSRPRVASFDETYPLPLLTTSSTPTSSSPRAAQRPRFKRPPP